MRSLKAPADHEPVIPKCTTTVVSVVGADVFGQFLNDKYVHRSGLVADILDLSYGSRVTPEVVARLLLHQLGGRKDIPDDSRWVPFINKVSSQAQTRFAADTAQLLLKGGARDVVVGALLSEDSTVKRYSKTAAVVLAAGGSTRMGKDMDIKQMLPWGKGTLVTSAAEAAIQSKVDTIKVVVGNQADRVGAFLTDMKVDIVCNKKWSHGQSGSVRVGLESLDENISGAIFLLVDQPNVGPEIINAIVDRFHETGAPIVVPRVAGRNANPVLFDRDLWPELHMIEGDRGGRELIRRYCDEVAWVDWNDDILNEINTPGDYNLMVATKNN
jgi:molybdenum cofactor cytidylyltransferase